jgi:hypothetical protein
MFSTNSIFRQKENLVGNQKCQAGFRLLFNKKLLPINRILICKNMVDALAAHFTTTI